MIARYATAIAVGAAVTFGLLLIMQLLIATGGSALTDARNVRLVDFVRVERNDMVETKKDKPEKPPEPERPPDMPKNLDPNQYNNALAVSMSSPSLSAGVDIGGVGFGVSDGEYLPIVKVAPIYPARASARGLEGYVILEYTVTRAGTTRDIFVVESTNSVFDRAAVDAASKFKYKPRVIDGEPVDVPGVQHKITFVLEK